MTIGNKIKELRKKENFTQSDLADRLFVSRNAVSKWESNKGIPNIDSLASLAKLFHTSIEELIDNELLVHDELNLKKYMKFSFFNLLVFIVLNGGLHELTQLFALSTIHYIFIIVCRVFLFITLVYIDWFILAKRFLSIKQKRIQIRILFVLSLMVFIVIILTVVSTFT